jgi:membrane fusion protein, copper/silver efflux system
MNMKSKLINLFVLVLLGISACNHSEKSTPDLISYTQTDSVYTCPMHPEVVQKSPGTCPKCNMKLEKQEAFTASNQIISPNKQVLSRQATIKLKRTGIENAIKVQGYIDFDRTRNKSVSARFGGRIEELYAKYNFQNVKKGDKIMEIYSPELNTIQEQHLFLLESKNDSSLLEQSRMKLRLLGITESQISALERNKKVSNTITVHSPYNGYLNFDVITRSSTGIPDPLQPQMSSMNSGNDEKSNTSYNNPSIQIREGQYINKGETLFNINDLEVVWGIISIPAEFQSQIDSRSKVKIYPELSSQPITGTVLLTEKTFEEGDQKFSRLRIQLPNVTGELKLNSLFTAEIFNDDEKSFQLPASAVYKTGLNSFVWVKADSTAEGTGIFRLRKVVTGPIANGRVTVINGISVDEEIAEHAGFLTDSETFLYEN